MDTFRAKVRVAVATLRSGSIQMQTETLTSTTDPVVEPFFFCTSGRQWISAISALMLVSVALRHRHLIHRVGTGKLLWAVYTLTAVFETVRWVVWDDKAEPARLTFRYFVAILAPLVYVRSEWGGFGAVVAIIVYIINLAIPTMDARYQLIAFVPAWIALWWWQTRDVRDDHCASGFSTCVFLAFWLIFGEPELCASHYSVARMVPIIPVIYLLIALAAHIAFNDMPDNAVVHEIVLHEAPAVVVAPEPAGIFTIQEEGAAECFDDEEADDQLP